MEPACFAGGCWRNDQVSVWAGGLAWMRVSHAQCVRLGSTVTPQILFYLENFFTNTCLHSFLGAKRCENN